jgi:hypothetical protein
VRKGQFIRDGHVNDVKIGVRGLEEVNDERKRRQGSRELKS